MLCCSWAMCFSAAPSSGNDHGNMNFAGACALMVGQRDLSDASSVSLPTVKRLELKAA